jgi:hypothetical protein
MSAMKDVLAQLNDAYSFLRDPEIGMAIDEIVVLKERIKELEAALREKDNIAYIIDGHGVTHNTFTIIYREKKDD